MVIITMLLTFGCANGPAWQPEDDNWTKAGKTAIRVPMGILTLGLSEAMIAMDKRQRADQQARSEWFNNLTPEQQIQVMNRRPAIIMGTPNFMVPQQPLQPMTRTTPTNCINNGSTFQCF